MKAFEFLIEYNIYNQDELKEYLEDFAKEVSSPEAKSWFMKQAKKAIINSSEQMHPTRELDFSSAPEWAQKAFQANDLYSFVPYGMISIRLSHIMDWFKWLEENNPRELKKLTKLTLDVAIDKSEEWVEQLNKKVSDEEDAEGLVEIMKFKSGFRIVKLTTSSCLNREGKLMVHCVGSYAHQLERGTEIYSLRDPQNNPHATIEVKNQNEITQIKGKQNKPPINKYAKYIIDFINKSNFKVLHDLENIGLVNIDGKIYDINNLPNVIDGDLILNWTNVESLPDNLKITGQLSLIDAKHIFNLPDNLDVGETLNVSNTNIETLPANLQIGGSLLIFNTKITKLPDDLRVIGKILINQKLEYVPYHLEQLIVIDKRTKKN